jgi:hypothetical protein
LILNVDIGPDVPAVRGTDKGKIPTMRSNSTYTKALRGDFSHQYKESNGLNKTQHDWILSNKFEYGYDPNGGRKLASFNTKNDSVLQTNEIKKILSTTS